MQCWVLSYLLYGPVFVLLDREFLLSNFLLYVIIYGYYLSEYLLKGFERSVDVHNNQLQSGFICPLLFWKYN